MTLFSPDQVRTYNSRPGMLAAQRIPLPAAFRAMDDILQLPLQSVTVGIGDAGVLQENGGHSRSWNTLWLYAEDAWRLHDGLTLTYGLGWGGDGLLNDDLRKPILLAPILGAEGLGPTRNNWTNFSPVVGVAWTPSADGRTVVRAGAGRFHRPHGLTSSLDAERVALGPPGLGRQNLRGSAILNQIAGIPGLPVGAPLEFRGSPTLFTGADLMAILPAIRAGLVQTAARADPTVQQIQINKHALPAIFPVNVPNPSAVHVNVGVQRQLAMGFVLSADAVYRHFEHVPQGGGSIDVNHFDSVRGAAVPRCTTAAEGDDPHALCSLGPINVQVAPYHFTYKGLTARLEKRLSDGLQVLGSYTLLEQLRNEYRERVQPRSVKPPASGTTTLATSTTPSHKARSRSRMGADKSANIRRDRGLKPPKAASIAPTTWGAWTRRNTTCSSARRTGPSASTFPTTSTGAARRALSKSAPTTAGPRSIIRRRSPIRVHASDMSTTGGGSRCSFRKTRKTRLKRPVARVRSIRRRPSQPRLGCRHWTAWDGSPRITRWREDHNR